MPDLKRHQEPLWLHDKVALVVGGTSGIGLAIATGPGDAGARFCVAGRSADKLQAALAALGASGNLDRRVGAAVYLASPAATNVTGESIRVDGGFLAAGI